MKGRTREAYLARSRLNLLGRAVGEVAGVGVSRHDVWGFELDVVMVDVE